MFTRQFKALGRIAAFFAGTWGAVGTLLSVLGGGPLLPSLLTYGLLFGAVGGVSGLATGLLLARGESGRRFEEVPVWRAALWGFLGGFMPAGLFAGLAIAFGTVAAAIMPLLVLGVVSGTGMAGLAAFVSDAAKKTQLGASDGGPSLPAT